MEVVDIPRYQLHSGVSIDTIRLPPPLVCASIAELLPVVMHHHSLVLNSALCVGETDTFHDMLS